MLDVHDIVAVKNGEALLIDCSGSDRGPIRSVIRSDYTDRSSGPHESYLVDSQAFGTAQVRSPTKRANLKV